MAVREITLCKVTAEFVLWLARSPATDRRNHLHVGLRRDAVEAGLEEFQSGLRCLDAVHRRGRKKAEVKSLGMVEEIPRIVEPTVKGNPKFQTAPVYAWIMAQNERDELLGHDPARQDVPYRETIGAMFNRTGYRLRRVLKAKPQRIPETDALFAYGTGTRTRTAADPECLRISIDSKAKVKIGPFSTGEKSRLETKATDHDMPPDVVLVPFIQETPAIYERGVTLAQSAFHQIVNQLQRDPKTPKMEPCDSSAL